MPEIGTKTKYRFLIIHHSITLYDSVYMKREIIETECRSGVAWGWRQKQGLNFGEESKYSLARSGGGGTTL